VCHHVRVAARRVAAVIVRRGRLLMVRERGRGPSGRHDGLEYWTLPGGGIEPGETPEAALTREVREEVGLTCRGARSRFDVPYPSGRTACSAVAVAVDELPRLGREDLACDRPRLVGLEWVALPDVAGETDGMPVPLLLVAAPPLSEPQAPPAAERAVAARSSRRRGDRAG